MILVTGATGDVGKVRMVAEERIRRNHPSCNRGVGSGAMDYLDFRIQVAANLRTFALGA